MGLSQDWPNYFIKENNNKLYAVHSDKLWDKDVSSITNKTHLDLDYTYNNDNQFQIYENNNMSKYLQQQDLCSRLLNKPHEVTLICYNCSWFKVYEKWNNDYDKAVNNQFVCPKCGRNDVKLISSNPRWKDLVNDAFYQLQYQSIEHKKRKIKHKLKE